MSLPGTKPLDGRPRPPRGKEPCRISSRKPRSADPPFPRIRPHDSRLSVRLPEPEIEDAAAAQEEPRDPPLVIADEADGPHGAREQVRYRGLEGRRVRFQPLQDQPALLYGQPIDRLDLVAPVFSGILGQLLRRRLEFLAPLVGRGLANLGQGDQARRFAAGGLEYDRPGLADRAEPGLAQSPQLGPAASPARGASKLADLEIDPEDRVAVGVVIDPRFPGQLFGSELDLLLLGLRRFRLQLARRDRCPPPGGRAGTGLIDRLHRTATEKCWAGKRSRSLR